LFGVLPTTLLDWGDDVIVRYRYRNFWRFGRCATPRPEQRHRFVGV